MTYVHDQLNNLAMKGYKLATKKEIWTYNKN